MSDRSIDARGPAPVVHLELHCGDRTSAAAFYDRLLRWPTELIDVRSGTSHALGARLGATVLTCHQAGEIALWQPRPPAGAER